jgi:hypothetical protein
MLQCVQMRVPTNAPALPRTIHGHATDTGGKGEDFGAAWGTNAPAGQKEGKPAAVPRTCTRHVTCPRRPCLAVRPTQCTKLPMSSERSNITTCRRDGKSSPRAASCVATSSLSAPPSGDPARSGRSGGAFPSVERGAFSSVERGDRFSHHRPGTPPPSPYAPAPAAARAALPLAARAARPAAMRAPRPRRRATRRTPRSCPADTRAI